MRRREFQIGLGVLAVVFIVMGILGFRSSFPTLSKLERPNALSVRQVHRTLSSIQKMVGKMVLPEAKAASSVADNFGNMVRMFYFMVAGYPGVTETATELVVTDGTTYQTLNNCTDATLATCDGPPPAGLLSLYNQFILGYQDSSWNGVAGILQSNGIATCSDLPSSGDLSPPATLLGDGQTLTVTAATPSIVIPTGHTGADGTTTYEKRLEITFSTNPTTTMKFLVEINCPTAAQMAAGTIQLYTAINFPEGETDVRIIEFYADKLDLDNQKYDFYMDYQSATAPQNLGFQMGINQTSGAINFDMVMANYENSSYNGMRFNVVGNVVDDDYSLAFQMISGASLSDVASGTGATSTSVTRTYAGGALQDGDILTFCLEGDGTGTYAGPDDSLLGSATSCTGQSVTENTEVPAIDPNGSWTIEWIAKSTGLDSTIWSGAF